jgi:hypothetical protein
MLHVHELLGNVLVNKFSRREILGKQSVARLCNNRRGCVFYVVRAEQWWNNRVMQPICKQQLGKHFQVSSDIIKNRDGVFCGVCAEYL